MINWSAFKSYKSVAILLLLGNILVQIMPINFWNYSLFPYLDEWRINVIFSLTMTVIILLIKLQNFKFLTLFNGIIFIDSILVYNDIKNFLVHVLFVVVITQFYYRIKLDQKELRNIQDHLLDE